MHSRRHGHSAAAAWAYRSGRCYTCARTGAVHDYRPRSRRSDDVVETGLAWTEEIKGTPALARDEQLLLDAIECAERRRDAKILRDIQLALPPGLGIEVLGELVRAYAQWVANEYGTLVMWAIHRPGRRGDQRNIHAHILVPTRALAASGTQFGPKLRVLDDWESGPAEICKIRNQWCEQVNARLKRAGVDATIRAGRRIDAPPMPTIPERFVVRDFTMKRAAGLATEPMRVAELASRGEPENPAMARIAAHVAAGYDVPASERRYEEKARPYYERVREHDATERDAAYYAGLPVVREGLEEANAELAALEARIEAHVEANAPGPSAPEPVMVVPARPVLAPPALEDDDWGREPELAPGPGLVLDVGDEPGLPEPIVVVPARVVLAPPALEDDDWAREPELVPGPVAVFDAGDEPALPEPVAAVPARPVLAPPLLEDDEWAREPVFAPQAVLVLDAGDEPALPEPVVAVPARPVLAPPLLEDDEDTLERELERHVEDIARIHTMLERIELKVARELCAPDWLAATIEESMRREVRDAPQWEPRLADIPRGTETNEFGVVVWRVVLDAEMTALGDCGNDRERIERHIATVGERATTDAPWRNQVIAKFAASISPSYLADLGRVGYFRPEPPEDEAEDALLERLVRQGAAGGLDAWSEQSVARAAGLEANWSFGEWSRARESGLLAEDVLRLHLHDAVRAARRLKRTFPGEPGPGPGGPTTLREWHRGLARVVSDVRERLRDPKTRDDFMTDLAMRMVPDLRAEWADAGEAAGRGPMPEAPPTTVERDRTLRELVRQRARKAGIEATLDNGDRARLHRELDKRLERMLEDICLFGVRSSLALGALAPDGVPESGKTARALARDFARWLQPSLDQIRAVEGSGRKNEERRRVLEGCRKYVSDATKRRRVVDGLVAVAGAHYEVEWLPPLESADPRGARERGELRAELEAQILASAEAAGEARILGHAGIAVTVALPGVPALDKLLDDGGFVEGITHGRPEREPVRSAVERWRAHCETHDVASMLLKAMWPEHWKRYRKSRRRGEPQRVPMRGERDQAVLDATRPPAPTQRRRSRDQGPDHGPEY